MTSPWDSEFSAWRARASLHPGSPDNFTPTRDALALIVLDSTPRDPDGFTLAFFEPNIAVDAMGRIIDVKQEDFDGIVSLAKQTVDLPQTGSFMNTWRLERETTSMPIERLFVPAPASPIADSEGLVQTSVYGYAKGVGKLKSSVGGITELPDLLKQLFGLFEEARGGYQRGQEDKDVIRKVRDVVGDL